MFESVSIYFKRRMLNLPIRNLTIMNPLQLIYSKNVFKELSAINFNFANITVEALLQISCNKLKELYPLKVKIITRTYKLDSSKRFLDVKSELFIPYRIQATLYDLCLDCLK